MIARPVYYWRPKIYVILIDTIQVMEKQKRMDEKADFPAINFPLSFSHLYKQYSECSNDAMKQEYDHTGDLNYTRFSKNERPL